VAVISDTHIRRDAERALEPVRERLRHADHVIHAGDFACVEAVRVLRAWKPFTGVWGNVDPDAVRAELPERAVVELAGYRIGVVHGHGSRGTTMERALEAFGGEPLDAVVFGHSHQPLVQTRNQVLLVNPGSALDKRRERWFSYVELELTGEGITASLHLW
jgi:putative phosphoesterase